MTPRIYWHDSQYVPGVWAPYFERVAATEGDAFVVVDQYRKKWPMWYFAMYIRALASAEFARA